MSNDHRCLRELKQLKHKIELVINHNKYIKKLYEGSNKKDKTEKYVIITEGSDKNIFSGISDDTIEYLKSTGDFDLKIFNPNSEVMSSIAICSLYDTIVDLVNVFDFQCDLHEKLFWENS